MTLPWVERLWADRIARKVARRYGWRDYTLHPLRELRESRYAASHLSRGADYAGLGGGVNWRPNPTEVRKRHGRMVAAPPVASLTLR